MSKAVLILDYKTLKPLLLLIYLLITQQVVFGQYQTNQPSNPTSTNLANPATFKQEIARFQVDVYRDGEVLSLSQVPRLQKDDILKVRLLNEAVNGVKLDQTDWEWTLLVTFINPLVRSDDKSVSAEVNFKKSGWYKEYSFKVPYDSQPILFLSPRAKYRNEVVKVISKNSEEIQKIGEKTIEIANAFAQIQTFLSELQTVIHRNQFGIYNDYNQYGYNNSTTNTGYNNGYNNGYSNGYNTNYNQYGYNNGVNNGFNPNPHWSNEMVERLAKSFQIQLPNCWRTPSNYSTNNYNNNNGYNNNYNNGYNNGYNGYTNDNYEYGQNSNWNTMDFVSRAQCVAKNVNLRDFEVSVTRMWQQGGVFLAAELQKKYPQLAYYINIAAAAIDFIVKVFRKAPIRFVPTIVSASDNPDQLINQTTYQSGYANPNGGYVNAYQQNFQLGNNASPATSPSGQNSGVKISVYAGVQPNDNDFVTAYPIVVHKWQAEADPDVISLSPPVLTEPCLHSGLNILRNTDLSGQWSDDKFTREFKLILNSTNGFRKEFSLKKNLGLGGWELNLTPQEMANFPKVEMSIEAVIVGMRGFNQISSPPFKLTIAGTSKWEIIPESTQNFAVGGKRTVVIRNSDNDCRCLQSITYKPSFGGQFVFEPNKNKNGLQFSEDGKEVWFEIDTANFQAGAGKIEVKSFGSEPSNLELKLYPEPPQIDNLRVSRGDQMILISGKNLDQIKFVIINGYKASIQTIDIPVENGLMTKAAVFDNPKARQNSDNVKLQLGLEDNRIFDYPRNFPVLPARPAFAANELGEIEGTSNAELFLQDSPVNQGRSINAELNKSREIVFPINTSSVSLTLHNILPDYDLKTENLKLETRIEKSQIPAEDLIKTEFEVLDWRTIKIKFFFTGEINKIMGGRRIQFRINDKFRGFSDWYTITQTFIRVPQILSVKCLPEMEGMCEMKGMGIEYIKQISIDEGKNWFPQEPAYLSPQTTLDGLTAIRIPGFAGKKNILVKIRDFPSSNLNVADYSYLNLYKGRFPLTNQQTINQTDNLANQTKPVIPVLEDKSVKNKAEIPVIEDSNKREKTVVAKKIDPIQKVNNQTELQNVGSITLMDEIIEMKKPD